MRWILFSLGLLLAMSLAARAQQPGGAAGTILGGLGDGSALAPPALPPTLPGGLPLPNLPAEAQQEILQRLRDAAAGRTPMSGPLPAPSAPSAGTLSPLQPNQPSYGAAAPSGVDPLSNTEAFFANRLGLVLRQFGYDSFSAAG